MRVLIVGAGGHAQVVADILLAAAENGAEQAPIGYLDDNPDLTGRSLLGLPVWGPLTELQRIAHDQLILAIGDNAVRRRLYRQLAAQGEHFAIARHPASIVAREVVIGPGAVLCAGVVVNPGSSIGANAILNTGCTLDHHNRVGDHVHVAPGAHTGGEVEIGEGALVGLGATILPRCRVGNWSRVGAGAVVHRSVADGETVIGVPAQRLYSPQVQVDS